MALSSDLISQFVKLTNDDKENKSSNTVYGTVVEYEGEKYVRVDGSERLTRANQITDTKVNDRVIVTIENHTATVTGNISSPSASSERVEDLGGDVQKVAILMAGKIDAEQVVADWAKIEQLITNKLTVSDRLDAAEAVIVTLDATYARFDELQATNAEIDKLKAYDIEVSNLFAEHAIIENLSAINAMIGELDVENADIRKLFANYATINKLDAEIAEITKLTAGYVTTGDLEAVTGQIGLLDVEIGDIKALTSEFISGNTVQTNFANAVIAQLGDAQIKSAMIKEIITDEVTVGSRDGSLCMFGSIFQVKDNDKNVRIQIGKDASDNYSFSILDADGNALFYEDGITANGIPDKIIVNDMVDDDADISASKLNINSLFEVINEDESHTLKSSKVKLDEEGQTLDVAFKSMTTKVFGRNLIAGTSSDTVYSGVVAPDSTLDYKDVWSAKTIGEVNGTEYVVSFDAKADEEIGIRCFFYSPNTTLTSESSTGDHRNNVEDGTSYVHVTTEWKRYWVKWTQTSTNTKKTVIVGRNSSLTNRVYIRAVKLEAGDKATAWTPAPEDIGFNTVKTTELSTNYHNLTVDIGLLRSTIVDQSQLIDSKADDSRVSTLESNYSDLVQEIDEISGTVSANTTIIDEETGETISLSSAFSQFKLDLEGFETTVNGMSIGGRNLLLNTGRDGTIKLNTADAPSHLGSVQPTNSGGLLTLNCSTSTQEIYYRFMNPLMSGTNMYGLEPGGTYTFSGKVKVLTTSGTLINVVARSQDRVGAWSGGAATVIADADSDEWISFESTFTIRENAECCYTSIQVYYEGSWTGVVQLKDLKFEKGSMATDWTPAPEDIDANISKSAETITKQTKDLLGQYAKSSDLDDYCTNSAFEQTANSIVSRVEGLSLSGKNIIENVSQKETVLGGYPTSGHSEGVSGKTSIIPTDNEYVLSFEAKSTVDGDRIRCHFYSPNTTLTVETSTSPGVIGNAADGMATLPVTTSWKRYWVKYTQNGAETTSKKSWIVGRRMAGLGSGSISVRAIKLESGTQATGWDSSSEIRQLADSISLSVTGSLGQSATIKLSANGETTTQTIDMSDVRQAFANDNTAVLIEAGTVTFNSGTLLINSDNFTLDETGYIVANSGSIGGIELTGYGLYGGTYGSYFGLYKYYDIPGEVDQICFFAGALDTVPNNPKFYVTHSGRMYAEDATIKGSITTTDGILTTELNAGSLSYYYNDDLRLTLERKGLGLYYNGSVCGYVTSELIEDVYQTTSLILRVPNGGVIRFVSESLNGGANTNYSIVDQSNVTFDQNDTNTYTHHFNNSVEMVGPVWFRSVIRLNSMAYFKNQCTIGWYDKDGGGPQQLITFSSSNIFEIGSTSYTTTIEGSIINLSAKSRVHMINGVEEIIFDGLESIGTYSGYFYPKTSGYCCLGVSANRWYRLYAANDCSISSDIRLKENIVPLGSNLTTTLTLGEEVPIDIHSELFDRLIPVQYNMIDGDDRIRYGFVAQQVSSAMAELGIDEDELDLIQHDHWVDEQTGESREEYGMVYNNLIAMLVHEVQKLKREIKTLKGE